ncbi:MAG: MBOAT family protein [Desulfobulbaceae bacterium]|nr:MBOAT family protein [Desulfobulbaceae bacterium]
MIFSSVIFVFFFLPLVLGTYFLAGRRVRNFTLLAASLLFYTWGEGVYLVVMLTSILMNYLCGLFLASNASKTSSKRIVACGIILNLVLLGFFKYANFIIDNLNGISTAVGMPTVVLGPVHLPIGISFFTFQAMSYLIDVYRGKVKPERNLINLSLYITLFPQLIAGPIVRYSEIATEIVLRKVDFSGFACGVQRFLFGLSKKVLIANPLAAVADQIFALKAHELSPEVAWIGALCYTFQIYFDFSGYSDMAIGLGKMFGFTFPENFNYPYAARSFRDFWRRWHISLSSWLKDYLYIPLGGSRHGNRHTYLNLLVVFMLCGLWHGASWTFVLWGLYHGLFLTLERTWIGEIRQRLWIPAQQLTTFVLVVFGWVLFRSETLGDATQYIMVMFGGSLGQSATFSLEKVIDTQIVFVMILAVTLALPLYPVIQRLQKYLVSTPIRMQIWFVTGSYLLQLWILGALTYFTVISLAAEVYNPFIYYRF